MKVLVLHLSDMHIKNKDDSVSVEVGKIISGLRELGKIDESIIVISGDLAFSGKSGEYEAVASLLGAIIKGMRTSNICDKKMGIICAPGNHDIDFSRGDGSLEENNKEMCRGNTSVATEKYIRAMKDFFQYVAKYDCFKDDRVVSCKEITYGEHRIGFVMLNTAPLSLLGGEAEDMGTHCLSEDNLKKLEKATNADINILVMHHSLEWFASESKSRIRDIITKKYTLVMSGHEHETVGENKNINAMGNINFIQGNALICANKSESGYCAITMDFDELKMLGYSYDWKKDFYHPTKILSGEIRQTDQNEIRNSEEFIEILRRNNASEKYYVFPTIEYSEIDEDDEMDSCEINSQKELFDLLESTSRIFFLGEKKSGKTTLAYKIYMQLYKKGVRPLYFNVENMKGKKTEKLIEYAFNEQYEKMNYSYDKFLQLDPKEKVAIIDGSELIEKDVLNQIVETLEGSFSKIIVFSEEKFNIDFQQKVVDTLSNKKSIEANIRPFWYSKRKQLIGKVLENEKIDEVSLKEEIKEINDFINSQVKYFNLTPEFIVNFVKQYVKDYKLQFMTGTDVFSVVYENSVRSKIINNAEKIDVNSILNILRDLAYYMHFERKAFVCISEIENVVNNYKREYRQNISLISFMNVTRDAKILIESDNKYGFKDHTLVAYFVAQAINQKYNQDEEVNERVEELLNNLCFNINSDIILFMALITNNPKFINIIVNGALKHFSGIEELNFDKSNIKFIMETKIPVKETLPDDEEKNEREEVISRQEEDVKVSDIVELIDGYDYTDEDLDKLENKILVSFKYLEILSKILPAFSHNMKAKQQDEIAELIYRTTNKFLYMVLGDIGEDFEQFVDGLYEEISELREKKKIAKINVENIRKALAQMSSFFIVNLYQIVANTATTKQTIIALDSFDWNANSNYKLMNLMMRGRSKQFAKFSKQAISMDRQMDSKLEKSIIRFVVRNYFLENDLKMRGEAQGLFDHFFGRKAQKELKKVIVQRRIGKKEE